MGSGKLLTPEEIANIKARAPDMIRTPGRNRASIADELGISRTKLFFLERDDPDFKSRMNEAAKERNDTTAEAVESKFIERLLKGTATEAGYIFYLCNAMPESYKQQRVAIANNNNFNPMNVGQQNVTLNATIVALENSSDAELDAIINRIKSPSAN